MTAAPIPAPSRFSRSWVTSATATRAKIAHFFFPIPYEDPLICTKQAVAARMALGSSGLLDGVFYLFRQELFVSDPEYAQLIGLEELTVDTFAAALRRERQI